MLFSVSAVPAFAAETTTEITDTQQPVVIGEYDGYLTDVMISDGVTKRAVANVRINSYATYDEDDGIQVHVKLYVPWYESPKPEFTGMTGTVNVLMNKKSTNTAFAELADGEETIETDVDTGRTGNSGDKGTVSVSGVATANNLGLDMTTFFTMAAKQAVREQALPFKPDMNETPNIETLKAMAETEYLINHPEVRKTYDDVDKMMEDILG